MKKFVALVLSLMMVLSLAACGDSKSESADKNVPVTENNNEPEVELSGSVESDEDVESSEPVDMDEADDASGTNDGLSELLSTLSLVAPSDAIVGTGWEFSGGMVNGVDLNAEEAAQSLEAYGGTMNVVFDDAENISMVQGAGTLAGTYGVGDDGYMMPIVFDNNGSELKYVGLFADIDGTLVLMLLSDETGQNAVYFTQITEG